MNEGGYVVIDAPDDVIIYHYMYSTFTHGNLKRYSRDTQGTPRWGPLGGSLEFLYAVPRNGMCIIRGQNNMVSSGFTWYEWTQILGMKTPILSIWASLALL